MRNYSYCCAKLTEILKCCISSLIALLLPVASYGAVPDISFPASLDPAQVSQRLAIPENKPVTTSAPAIEKPAAPTGTAIPNAKAIKFKVTRIIFEGNTVYSQKQLLALFKKGLNKEVTLADMEALATAVMNYYRNNGYILTVAFIPPQRIQQGIIRIRVVEGYIDKVTVTGNPGNAKCLIERYGMHIVRDKPLRICVLERYVLLANDLPGITVKAVISASKTKQGAADLNLVTEKRLGNVKYSYDDYGSLFLGPQQNTLNLAGYSILRGGDSTIGQIVVTSNPKELRNFGLNQTEPWGSNGGTLSFSANYTKTQPGFFLDPFDIKGRSQSLSSQIAYPIIRSRISNLSAHGSFNYLNSSNFILETKIYRDQTRALDFGLTFTNSDKYKGANTIDFDFWQGLPIMGNSGNQFISHPRGRSVYTKFNGDVSRLQTLTDVFSALISLRGQYSVNPLLAGQQFSVGGYSYSGYNVGGYSIARGYEPSEISGDHGLGGTAEIQFTVPNTFYIAKIVNALQIYVFYDAGMIWNRDKVTQLPKASVTSTGVGVRSQIMPHVSAEAFFAKPLTRPVASLLPNGNRPRAFFQIAAYI